MSITEKKLSDIGHMISYIRSKKGLTQQEFADKIGVSKGMIVGWESGKNIPTTKKISQIAEVMNLLITFDQSGGVAFNENSSP